jgi:HPt (histidine-containing phosphotransfer) domain-containing protein
MPKQPQPPLRSDLSGDPEMAELIGLFLAELPKRVDSLTQAWRAREFQTIQRLAHQLKGSSAGYGFPAIGTAAAKVEDSIRANDNVQVDQLAQQVQELIVLCHRASPSKRTAA